MRLAARVEIERPATEQEGNDTLSQSASFSRQSSAPDLFAPKIEETRAEAPAGASWKDEVNQRLAAHRSRRGNVAEEQQRTSPQQSASSRAAQAAARVAARYAQAPTYSDLLAGEARAVVQAASAAVEAARDAQAAAEAVLAGLESRLPEVAAPLAGKQAYTSPSTHAAQTARWQDAPPAATENAANALAPQPRWQDALPPASAPEQDVWAEMRVYPAPALKPTPEYEFSRATYVEDMFPDDVLASATVEPIHSSAANLIEFPRELIAARKARPRLAEGPFAQRALENPQLSIFEVDPELLAAPVRISVAPPEWASIELEEPSLDERALYRGAQGLSQTESQAEQQAEQRVELGPLDHHNFFESDQAALDDEPSTDWNDFAPGQAHSYQAEYANPAYGEIAAQPDLPRTVADFHHFPEQTLAGETLPLAAKAAAPTAEKVELLVAAKSDRLLATIVDGALVALAWLAAATVAIASTDHPPSGVVALEATALALPLFAILYLAIFFGFSAEGTPGMRYARIALCTFDDNNPTVAQSLARIPALLVAALPAGLGLAWAMVDGEGLGLHDRLSKTYQRKY